MTYLIQPGEGAEVDETDETLREMAEDGFDVANDDTDDESATKDKAQENDEDSEDEEAEEEDDSDEEDSDDSDSDDSDDDDEDSEEDDGEADDDDEPKGRGIKTIPVWKHKVALKKREKELRKEIEDSVAKAQDGDSTAEDIDDEVKSLADEFGFDENTTKAVKAIIVAASKRSQAGLNAEDVAKLQSKINDMEEEKLFNREVDKSMPRIKKLFPDASSKQMTTIMGQIKDLAYTEEYQKLPLHKIAKLHQEELTPKAKRKTGEGSGSKKSGSRGVTAFDLDNPDSIPWDQLSEEEFEKVSDALEKKSGSNLRIVKRNR